MSYESRKIVNISVTTDGQLDVIYAVCDDGSLWKRAETIDPENRKWERIPDIDAERME